MTAREDVAASRQRLFALPTINALKGVAWPHRGDRGVMVAAGERDPCFNAGQSGQAAALRPLRALTGIDGIRIDLTTAPRQSGGEPLQGSADRKPEIHRPVSELLDIDVVDLGA